MQGSGAFRQALLGWRLRYGVPAPGRRPRPRLVHAAPAALSQLSISRRAMLMDGGMSGRSWGENQRASTISVPSTVTSPEAHETVNPIMSEWGNGQGWLAK